MNVDLFDCSDSAVPSGMSASACSEKRLQLLFFSVQPLCRHQPAYGSRCAVATYRQCCLAVFSWSPAQRLLVGRRCKQLVYGCYRDAALGPILRRSLAQRHRLTRSCGWSGIRCTLLQHRLQTYRMFSARRSRRCSHKKDEEEGTSTMALLPHARSASWSHFSLLAQLVCR